MDSNQLIFTVADRSYFALLKKDIHALAAEVSFSSERAGRVDIIVAELVSNLVKHGTGGHLIAKKILDVSHGAGIELISIDNGPGIDNVKKMMEDGESTKNTLGQGLGAMQRLSDQFEIYTQKDWGTILMTRIFKEEISAYKKPSPVALSSIVLPKPGEQLCGDGFFYRLTKDKLSIIVGDGLGHGPEAAKAVNAAIEAFKNNEENDPVEIIRMLHESVKRTRGLVATVAVFNFKEKCWSICGVGNIAARMSSFISTKAYMSYNGIIGHNIPRSMKIHEVPYEPGQTILLCSDGIKTRWDLSKYPAIGKNDLSILTAAIYKDHSRNTDDSSVIAVKLTL